MINDNISWLIVWKIIFHILQDLQDRALKITKATERLISPGHFASEQATAQAYSVLNLSAEYLDIIEQREALLLRAIAFFRSAHTVSLLIYWLSVRYAAW